MDMWYLVAFVRTREVGVSSRNVVSRTFPNCSQSMLTPMHTMKIDNVFKIQNIYFLVCIYMFFE